MFKLSIIVPVYNVAPYVKKCLESIIHQDCSHNEYEVVVVNDGSTDNSLEIINSLDWNGLQHTVITQDNSGLSAARNKGLSLAQGEYVWFIDSDDWIENCLSSMFECLKGQDMLVVPSYFKNEGDRQSVVEVLKNEGTGREFSKQDYPQCVPFYIYKRTFFDRIGFAFQPGIYHEDALFTPRAIYLADFVKVYTSPVYHYLMREGSITNVVNPKRIEDLMYIIATHLEFGKSSVSRNDYQGWSSEALGTVVNNLLFQTIQCKDSKLNKRVEKFLCVHKELARICTYSRSFNTKMLGLLGMLLGNLYMSYKFLFKLRYR